MTAKKTAKKATKKAPARKAKKSSSSKLGVNDVQPVVNIGLVGHVDHGKTTLTQALSGQWTDTHSEEMKRGITIRLGYADSSFFKDAKGNFTVDKTKAKSFVRKVSFVDAPGHESLMATMLAGAKIMDGALLLIAANEACPQPQTREHLMALEISGIENVIIVQNKIDLVDEDRAMRNYSQIQKFLKGTKYESAPIIPISAQHRVNIDVLIGAIEEIIPTPKHSEKDTPLMFVARSFDINKPGYKPSQLEGGVLGGSLVSGTFSKNDEIEIRPGRIVEEANQLVAKPLRTKISEIMTGGKKVDKVIPGGTMALLTDLDASIVKSDSLVGNLVGYPDKLPPVWTELKMETHLLDRVVGVEDELKVDPLKMHEPLMLNVNSAATVGVVTHVEKKFFKCKLKLPVCATEGSRVAISRRVGTRFRLIGYGIILK